ncbi:MAG: hypothetical protein DMG44_17725 [Acidobacteria bacterium]|nr:MAG: hypothetical protein DMG44_17725 [Acidobacteriota bacterium]
MDGSSFNWTELQSPVARPKELMQSQFDSGARFAPRVPPNFAYRLPPDDESADAEKRIVEYGSQVPAH